MKSVGNRKRWCSLLCKNKFAVETRNRRCSDCSCLIKNYTAVRCKKCAAKYIDHYWGDKISKSNLGRKHNWKNPYYKPGDQHPNWKGGATHSKRALFMGSQGYKDWRRLVFERDNYTCQECNVRGGCLHADHIKPYAAFPELRLDINNGRTLCANCHRKTPTWGYNKKYQVRPQILIPHAFGCVNIMNAA